MRMEHSSRPPKRLASELDDDPAQTKRLEVYCNEASSPPPTISLAAAPSAMEIRAFGLEDRAEAVISRGKESWALANLSKWRHESFDQACNTTHSKGEADMKLCSRDYLRQRQRAYRQQCLAASSRHAETHATTTTHHRDS